jgi:hypothetical protein
MVDFSDGVFRIADRKGKKKQRVMKEERRTNVARRDGRMKSEGSIRQISAGKLVYMRIT